MPRTYVPRFRAWCYTLNNPTAKEIEKLCAEVCQVHVVGRETGESGTPHLQGYIRFHCVRGLSWWKENYPRAHAEKRNGTEIQAVEYCRKDRDMLVDTHTEEPEPSDDSGKKRFKLAEEVMDEIDNGATVFQICKKHRGFYFYNRSAILRYKSDRQLWMRDETAVPDV